MEYTDKSSIQRQYVSFDLDTNELKKYYPTDNWRNAYEGVKKNMQKKESLKEI